jgi:NTE family protein
MFNKRHGYKFKIAYMKKKIGLALGSGGIKGMAHIGVLKTLEKNNIPIDFIAGSSIGAWIGAHYALHKDIKRLEEVTVGSKWEKLLALIEPTLGGGIMKGAKMEVLLAEWLEESNFSDTQIPLKIVATDLRSGDEVLFDSGPLASAIRASISVPSFFRPMEYQGKVLVDGGLVNPVPDNIVKHMGADIVIAVNINSFKSNGLELAKNVSVANVTYRSFQLLRHYLAQYTMNDADIIIEPQNTSYKLSSWKNYFTSNTGPEHVAIGVEATEKHLKEIIKLLEE